jgi:hypothetical protein
VGMRTVILVSVLALVGAPPGGAQELADFDYENLTFRGVGLEWGYVWPNKVEPTPSYGVRVDLGYLGPGLRITPSLTYGSSRMKRSEVAQLENRVASLIAGAPSVALGTIDWSDVAFALDAQMVWRVPYGILTFAGLGASVHFLNGDGVAIADTFIEDLLDSVSAGLGLHAGVEYPLNDHFRIYTSGRLELLEDIRYSAIRAGLQIHRGRPAPGEERSR